MLSLTQAMSYAEYSKSKEDIEEALKVLRIYSSKNLISYDTCTKLELYLSTLEEKGNE